MRTFHAKILHIDIGCPNGCPIFLKSAYFEYSPKIKNCNKLAYNASYLNEQA